MAGASRFATLMYGQPLGTPRVDLAAERRVAALMIAAVAAGLLQTCKVVSRGGLLSALARLAVASGVGIDVALPASAAPLWQGFGEHPAQVPVSPQDDGAAARWRCCASSTGYRFGDWGSVRGRRCASEGCCRSSWPRWRRRSGSRRCCHEVLASPCRPGPRIFPMKTALRHTVKLASIWRMPSTSRLPCGRRRGRRTMPRWWMPARPMPGCIAPAGWAGGSAAGGDL